jgi:hypothetical protein
VQIRSSALPLGSSACERTVHGRSPISVWIGISEKERGFIYSTRTREPIYDFSRIPRASRASLTPINRSLTFEEKKTSFGEELEVRSRRIFVFLSSFIYFLYVYIFSLN